MIFTLREGERNAEIPYSTFFTNNLEQAPLTQLKYVPTTSATKTSPYAKHFKVPGQTEQGSIQRRPSDDRARGASIPPVSPSNAPQTPVLRRKESSAYIRTALTPRPRSWCSALDQ
ncbi:hypothetical protein EVAR_99826_1 [Eumeta japonica]|uniref:Uncharacterized protein n=1 Tax=Eumeta variegata TaxID=151549 RepID=A0A4C2A4X2_EUMVA|nr:hypothetical protein EVAR_99826_1 [Eumeta japonica]